MLVKKAEDFITSKWSGGSTTELYIYPPQSLYREGNFKCRISSATVEVEKSDFTSLPGVKRYLSIFSGELKMIHGEKEEVILEPFEVDCFDGGVPTVSYGKVVDFNLMLKNGADGEMQAKEMQAEEEMILKRKSFGCLCENRMYSDKRYGGKRRRAFCLRGLERRIEDKKYSFKENRGWDL